MTKRRPPGKIHDAVNRAIALLTYEVAAEVTGLSQSYLRQCTDQDQRKTLSLAAAAKIDQALHERGELPVLRQWLRDQCEVDEEEDAGAHIRHGLIEIERAMLRVEGGDSDPVRDTRSVSELMSKVGMLGLLLCDLADRQREARQQQRSSSPRLVAGGEANG